jgi:hypothetical protein
MNILQVDYIEMIPCLMAKWTNSALLLISNCFIRLYLWNSTVRVEIPSTPAASFADLPSANN